MSIKIDVFNHILPPKYRKAFFEVYQPDAARRQRIESLPTMCDIDARLRVMDRYEDYVQVLSLNIPPIELLEDSSKSVYLAKVANDEMAELTIKYPDRFIAAIACLPMNSMEEALKETDRAIKDLKFRGVQIYTPIGEKPLDSPEFLPLYEKMAKYNLPIFIHPKRTKDYVDYKCESRSMYDVYHSLAWPYETSVAMVRLVYSGILEKYPNLKFITHHCGGMIPYFDKRIQGFYGQEERRLGEEYKVDLTRPVLEYFKMFYNDTALYGATQGLMCAHAFCGAEHILFATDMPHDNQYGNGLIRETISSIERMDISAEEKKMIFSENARKLLRLLI